MGTKTVLILSKSKFFSEALRFILYDLSVETEIADSWEKFINLSRSKTYDVIVCDLSCMDKNIERNTKDIKIISPHSKIVVFSFDFYIKNSYADCVIKRPLKCETVINHLKNILNSTQ